MSVGHFQWLRPTEPSSKILNSWLQNWRQGSGIKYRTTTLIFRLSRQRDFLSCLVLLKSLEHTLVALEPLPSALLSYMLSEIHIKVLSSPLASFPRCKKKLSKPHTPKISIYFLFHVDYLPPLSSAWVVIQMEFCQALIPTLGGCLPGMTKLLCSLRHISRCVNIQCFRTPQTKFLPAPPKDCECQINLVLQLFCSNHLSVTLTSKTPPPSGSLPCKSTNHSQRKVLICRLSSELVGKAGTPVLHW